MMESFLTHDSGIILKVKLNKKIIAHKKRKEHITYLCSLYVCIYAHKSKYI